MVDRLTHTTDEPDELYVKYRVYREPEVEGVEHPVEIVAYVPDDDYEAGSTVYEVEDFVFVLKPDTDQHARVALAAYVESVRPFKPHLARDLAGVLSLLEVEGEVGVEG